MTTVGIDFGTTNSVMAAYTGSPEVIPIGQPADGEWAELGLDKVMPTILGVTESGELRFGWDAKLDPSMEENGRRIEAIKRLFANEETVVVDGQTFMVEEIATMLFAEMRRVANEQGIEPSKAVITVPANSRALARLRTRLTAGMSGLHVLALINEPTAAAMAYAHSSPFDQRILVVDWGGGTLDVTLLHSDSGIFVEQASAGIARNGGLDFDRRVAREIAKTIPGSEKWSPAQRAAFRLSVEAAKIRLSTRQSTNILYPGGSYTLERSDFESWVKPLIEEVRAPVEKVLADVGDSAESIDAILLVGGTGKVPAVRDFVSNLAKQAPADGVNPLTAIAEGASIAAAILTGEAADKGFFVSTEHALGTYVLNPASPAGPRVFAPIIPRNHKLPAVGSEVYFPVNPTTDQVKVSIVEGDKEGTLETDSSNTEFAAFLAPIPPADDEDTRSIEIKYEYDVSGIIFVTVIQASSGEVILHERVAPGRGHGALNDKATLANISARARQAVEVESLPTANAEQSDLSREHLELINKAKISVLPFITDSDGLPIRALVEELETCPPSQRELVATRLTSALEPHSYLW